jgi:hypothetical protein
MAADNLKPATPEAVADVLFVALQFDGRTPPTKSCRGSSPRAICFWVYA